MNADIFLETIETFSKRRIAVIGDVMLDKYLHGKSRYNPETDAHRLQIERKVYALGGAANVAANSSSLGAKTELHGCAAEDHSGFELMRLCREMEIDSNILFKRDETVTKTRIYGSRGTQLMFLDEPIEGKQLIGRYTQESFIGDLIKREKESRLDAIILSDYNKGMFAGELPNMIGEFAREYEVPVIIDPKPVNANKFRDFGIICPNLKEAMEITEGGVDKDNLLEALKDRGYKSAVVTCGKDGAIGYDNYGVFKVPAMGKRHVYDVTGAGDTFCSALALGVASFLDLEDATTLASYAAGIAVEKPGTAVVTEGELVDRIQQDS
jgi:rfaE bifunctional protein kinase chain/domain